MFCRFCGRKIAEDSSFCPYCGKQLALATQEETPVTPQPEQTYVPMAAEMPVSQTSTTTKEPAKTPHSERGRWAVLAMLVLLLTGGFVLLFATKVICIHKWQEVTCTEPRTCMRCLDTEGEALGHSKKPANCVDPVTCLTCGEMFGNALGHDMQKATCTAPRKCIRCRNEFGVPKEHNWAEETATTPKLCKSCGLKEPMLQPVTGTVFIDENQYHGSRLKVVALSDYNTYVKLKDEDGNDVVSFYVRAKETANVRVPSGNYYIYFAHGIDWYGPEYAFGDDTVYQMNPEPMDFYNYTWEYTLDAGENGNTTSDTISEYEF